MQSRIVAFVPSIAFALTLVACGSSFPPPNERLASSEAASRSARELGAEKTPQAALHLKLASEQIDKAKQLMQSGDNERADFILQRASADAELSIALAKEDSAGTEAQKALDEVKSLKGQK